MQNVNCKNSAILLVFLNFPDFPFSLKITTFYSVVDTFILRLEISLKNSTFDAKNVTKCTIFRKNRENNKQMSEKYMFCL